MPEQHAVVTNEMVARARSRIGQVWEAREPWYNTQATRDTIRHFVNGIGDMNPLYRDPSYARGTRYGRIAAPPCFLYSVHWPAGQAGLLPGMHGWHAGNDWEWFKPILEGDEFTYTTELVDFVEKKASEMSGRSFIAYSLTTFRNQRGEVVAKGKGWSVVAERAASGERGKYKHIERASYTPEALEKIYDDCEREVIRGAESRYWEEVQVGEALTPVVKGPLSLRDINSWLMGAGSVYFRAHEIFVAFQRRHPAVGMVDSATGAVDVPELVHMESTRAQEIGVAGAYDYGGQRMCWLGHLLTNWMGDEGFLKEMHARLTRFNIIGDTTWCKGKVTRKYEENDEHLVEVECWGENQRGEVTMPGHAIIALPSRDCKAFPLIGRLPR